MSSSKQLIEDAFAAWARGEGSVFDVLADDATWTITGTSAIAKTYTSRLQFMTETLGVMGSRLAEPIRVTVERVIGDGDTVAVVWRGHAMANDGKPYDNHYCWVMRVADGKVVDVLAWFDSPTLTNLIERVPSKA